VFTYVGALEAWANGNLVLETIHLAVNRLLVDMADKTSPSLNSRVVAYPDRTAFFGDYFRMGGNPPGTAAPAKQFRFLPPNRIPYSPALAKK
jgi:hypothetical protein